MKHLLLALVAALLPTAAAAAGAADEAAPRRGQPWPDGVLEMARTLPVLEGGRVKPLSTFAAFRLLQIHGTRSLRVEDPTAHGETRTLSPTEWILDCLFFPDQVRGYELFLIEDRDAMVAVGISAEGKEKRDRWTYDELFAGADSLIEHAQAWSKLDEKARTPLQGHVLRTAHNFIDVHELLSRWEGLHLFPPPPDEEAWLTAPELSHRIAAGEEEGLEASRAALEQIATLFDHRQDMARFEAEFEAWHDTIVGAAGRRGEYDKIELEVRYYEADFFFHAQWMFVVGFLLSLAALTWMRSKVVYVVTKWWTLLPLAVLTAGIVVRCILRERPPVSTLYETILFISGVAVLAAWIIDAINRQRLPLMFANLLGAVGMWFAAWYEEISAVDTMPQLQAVLDTNFWLSTHVTTVSMGYSAGLLAAAIAHVYVFGKLFGFKRSDPAFYRNVARMVYGAVAFGLVFSTVGTILGGVWANDSWGRFWGWDPKENGALMIVLMNLIILHGRLGGYIRDWGLCLLSIFLGTVVAFSWFHVNLLGVGLHSYGFDDRLHTLVWSFYAVEWSVLGLGVLAYLWSRGKPGLA